ncbi:sugar phosphate nucleotidyltransferase [Sulfurimonas sp.]|jgi:mannose-1-phosphate guanylyltransferase/phosphomannomutase|uniref:sugar phosphate nucleotidyltransferase n=1 Tax=Sulfurimonas sp. TaxID=2022749 RepID=UPI0025E2BDAD|nr:sugar phosphate nucleotidyltransferase [Sulfurimonas sp.]MCK9472790.1 sugar phosphate nucleotidyltransferase [Sulfurimonas sp.]MDD3505140.1 sugar phosphate nucleotidyltransferase [Sulfurimonas sp.]
MKAIVLAGGFGTRIQPLTNTIPKPMLPILNAPMMEHIIIKLRDDLGIKDIAVLLYFMPEVIKEYFKDGEDLGVNITYFLPDNDYGTAGAVGFARDFLDETFIIVSGDLVTDFKFSKIYEFHKQKKSKLTIALTPVKNPLEFGVVIANKQGKIEKFLEKPSWGEVFSDTINTGIYIIEPEILDFIPRGENYDFAKDLFVHLMASNITLWGCHIEGYWRDVGNPQSYREVYQDIFEGKIALPIKGKKTVYPKGVLYLEKGASVDKSVQIKGLVVLGKNSKIEGLCKLNNSILGKGCTLGEEVSLSNTIFWQGCSVGSKTNIHNGVICNDVKIDKKVKAKHGVIIAQNCTIYKNVSFLKDVMVWPNKIIEQNSIISNNVIWMDKYKSSIFESGSVAGRANIELSCELCIKLAEALGSILPVGSNVYLSRDYHKGSRMLKRAFLSGLLSTGINAVDASIIPSVVMRYNLSTQDDIIAGVHFRQSAKNQEEIEILFYTNEGFYIDTNLSKNIERIFFRENFRRVKSDQIGDIYKDTETNTKYINAIREKIDTNLFKNRDIKIVTDLMFGSTSKIYPNILNSLDIEFILLNAYRDDKQLQKLPSVIKRAHCEVGKIVKSLKFDCGILIYPNGHKLQFISNDGTLVKDYIALLALLSLLDFSDTLIKKIFLPAWAPDFITYKHLDISRDKACGLKAKQLKDYNLIADTDGYFAFSEFSLNTDAVFSSFKFLELLIQNKTTLSAVIDTLPNFAYRGENIACSNALKGKMMRKFLEESKDKKSSQADGVKIWVSKNEWILMVPNEHQEFLNIYIQAKDDKNAEKIFNEYKTKIDLWMNK